MLKNALRILLVALTVGAVQAFAAAPATVADLTTGIDFSSVGLGILAVAGLMITVYVIKKGATMVRHAVKGM